MQPNIDVTGEPESGRRSFLRISVCNEADDTGLHSAAVAGLRVPAAAARATAVPAVPARVLLALIALRPALAPHVCPLH